MHHAFFRCAPSVHMQVVYELHHFYMVSAILHSPGILYQQVEYSTAEDPDSDSPTPATPSYPGPPGGELLCTICVCTWKVGV